jgi:hypothetical protein
VAELPKVFQDLDIDPYAPSYGTELIALRVRDLAPQDERNPGGLQRHGADIWRLAQQALLWWTPVRTEQEALKRAADDPQPSTLAREVALFTALFERYATHVVEVVQIAQNLPFQASLQFQVDLLRGTLEALERRAQAAEARATDYRLRYEFDRLRQVVAGRELGSKIADLIEQASKNTDSVEHMRALVEEVRPTIARMERDLALVRTDVDYTAERVMEESVRRMLPTERLKSSVTTLTDFVAAGTILGDILRACARFLG